MKKVKMLISFLLFLLFTSSQVKAEGAPKAQDIPVYKKGPHMGTRTTEPSVTANLEQEQLTVNVSHWYGVVKICIYDNVGNLVTNTYLIAYDKGLSVLDLSALEYGTYEISIEFDDMIYVGAFEL